MEIPENITDAEINDLINYLSALQYDNTFIRKNVNKSQQNDPFGSLHNKLTAARSEVIAVRKIYLKRFLQEFAVFENEELVLDFPELQEILIRIKLFIKYR